MRTQFKVLVVLNFIFKFKVIIYLQYSMRNLKYMQC